MATWYVAAIVGGALILAVEAWTAGASHPTPMWGARPSGTGNGTASAL